LIALPEIGENNLPYFSLSKAVWEKAKTVNDIVELQELIPIKLSYSAGSSVEPLQLKNAYLVKGAIDCLPFKSQEERSAWLQKTQLPGKTNDPLASHLGRRTGTSKCLSYATSSVADYWTRMMGYSLPRYRNFISGINEYGWDPRLLENIYFNQHLKHAKRFWMAPFGKDRVTGEKIPWSIKGYVEVLANTPAQTVQDRLDKNRAWTLSDRGFHMDATPVRIFKGVALGKTKKLKEALHKFGALLSQHTTRFSDNIPNPILAAHAVMIVGYFTDKGNDYFIYQESFGGNGAGYYEDSLGGPRYRAMPAKLIYQAWGFPHRLQASLKKVPGGLMVTPKNHEGRDFVVDQVKMIAAGNVEVLKIREGNSWIIPTMKLQPQFQLQVEREHFVPLHLTVHIDGDEVLAREENTLTKYVKGFEPLQSVLK
jgi:hypothetical protein